MDLDKLDDAEISILIETPEWPASSPIAPYRGGKGTPEDRRAALGKALRPGGVKSSLTPEHRVWLDAGFTLRPRQHQDPGYSEAAGRRDSIYGHGKRPAPRK